MTRKEIIADLKKLGLVYITEFYKYRPISSTMFEKRLYIVAKNEHGTLHEFGVWNVEIVEKPY